MADRIWVLLEQKKGQFYSDLRERACDVGRTERSCLGLLRIWH